MKSKLNKQGKFSIFTLIVILLNGFTPTHANAVEGTRGGGQTVDINGKPVLRDLVDKTVCLFIIAEDLAQQLPHHSKIMTAVDNAHWYLREKLEEEYRSLSVCQTNAPLIEIPVDDRDGLTVIENTLGKQVAIRLNQQIFIDMNLFEQLPAVDQAYTLLHEVTHSFLPMDTPRRNTKLRSFVAAVRAHEQKPMTQSQFSLQMSQNSLDIKGNTPIVTDPVKMKLFLTARDENATLYERQLAAMQLQPSNHVLIHSVADNILFFTGSMGLNYNDAHQLAGLVSSGYLQLLKWVKAGNLTELKRMLSVGYSIEIIGERLAQEIIDTESHDPHWNGTEFVFKSKANGLGISTYQRQFPMLLYPILTNDQTMVRFLIKNFSKFDWLGYRIVSNLLEKSGRDLFSQYTNDLSLSQIAKHLGYTEIYKMLQKLHNPN